MNRFFIFIYLIAFGSSFYYQNMLLSLALLIIGLAILAFIPLYRKLIKQNIQQKIKNNLKAININSANWWEFEELPTFTRVKAKKAVWIRKHNGNYSSKNDFYKKNSIKDEDIKKLDNIIF